MTGDATTEARQPPGRLAAIRTVSAVVTLLAVGSLGLVAAESGGTVVRHTTVTKRQIPRPDPPTASTSTAATTAAPAASDQPSAGATPLATVATPTSVTSAAAATAVLPSTAPASAGGPAPVPAAASASAPARAVPACPLPLPASTTQGGLQSLIAFAPLFGPFSAEAFGSAAAFQPVLELFGPFLVAFAQHYAGLAPSITPILDQVEALENQGYASLAPFYGPERTKFLAAETQLATALAPAATALVDNPAASCLIDIEGALVASH